MSKNYNTIVLYPQKCIRLFVQPNMYNANATPDYSHHKQEQHTVHTHTDIYDTNYTRIIIIATPEPIYHVEIIQYLKTKKKMSIWI